MGSELESFIERLCIETSKSDALAQACTDVLWKPHWQQGGGYAGCGAWLRLFWVASAATCGLPSPNSTVTTGGGGGGSAATTTATTATAATTATTAVTTVAPILGPRDAAYSDDAPSSHKQADGTQSVQIFVAVGGAVAGVCLIAVIFCLVRSCCRKNHQGLTAGIASGSEGVEKVCGSSKTSALATICCTDLEDGSNVRQNTSSFSVQSEDRGLAAGMPSGLEGVEEVCGSSKTSALANICSDWEGDSNVRQSTPSSSVQGELADGTSTDLESGSGARQSESPFSASSGADGATRFDC